MSSLLPLQASDDPAVRLDAVILAFTRLIADTEPQQRTMLRLSLEADAAEHAPGLLRQGRAIGWIKDALSPLRTWMPERALGRLILAIRSATGIEARVWLTDVAKLSSDDAIELMRWSARAMYRTAVAEHGNRPKRRRRRPRPDRS
jgi:hypothetical protein